MSERPSFNLDHVLTQETQPEDFKTLFTTGEVSMLVLFQISRKLNVRPYAFGFDVLTWIVHVRLPLYSYALQLPC